MEKNKQRNSQIELLKIIAMFLIAINHSLQFSTDSNMISYIKLGVSTTNLNILFLNILRCCGQVGNIIFVVCSAYFLLDSIKCNKKKILYIIIDSFTISMLWIIPFIIFKINIPLKDLIEQFAPITFQNNWFIGCYLMLYMIHPLLNIIINKLEQRQLLRVNLVLILLYCLLQFIITGIYYFNDLVGFIVIYFIIAYVKKYLKEFQSNQKLNILLLSCAIIFNLLLLITTNYMGLKIELLKDKVLYWNFNIANPFYIIIGITLFNIFNNKVKYNLFINSISKLSLLFYIIHENMLFRTYLKPYFYETVFVYNNILLWIAVEALILFIFGLLLAFIYKCTIQKIVYKFCDKIYDFTKKHYLMIEKFLLNK